MSLASYAVASYSVLLGEISPPSMWLKVKRERKFNAATSRPVCKPFTSRAEVARRRNPPRGFERAKIIGAPRVPRPGRYVVARVWIDWIIDSVAVALGEHLDEKGGGR